MCTNTAILSALCPPLFHQTKTQVESMNLQLADLRARAAKAAAEVRLRRAEATLALNTTLDIISRAERAAALSQTARNDLLKRAEDQRNSGAAELSAVNLATEETEAASHLAADATVGAGEEADKVAAAQKSATEKAQVELERRKKAEADATARRSSEGTTKAAQTGASGQNLQAQAEVLAAQEREVVNATVRSLILIPAPASSNSCSFCCVLVSHLFRIRCVFLSPNSICRSTSYFWRRRHARRRWLWKIACAPLLIPLLPASAPSVHSLSTSKAPSSKLLMKGLLKRRGWQLRRKRLLHLRRNRSA
jgi:hypothetical protein